MMWVSIAVIESEEQVGCQQLTDKIIAFVEFWSHWKCFQFRNAMIEIWGWQNLPVWHPWFLPCSPWEAKCVKAFCCILARGQFSQMDVWVWIVVVQHSCKHLIIETHTDKFLVSFWGSHTGGFHEEVFSPKRKSCSRKLLATRCGWAMVHLSLNRN